MPRCRVGDINIHEKNENRIVFHTVTAKNELVTPNAACRPTHGDCVEGVVSDKSISSYAYLALTAAGWFDGESWVERW